MKRLAYVMAAALPLLTPIGRAVADPPAPGNPPADAPANPNPRPKPVEQDNVKVDPETEGAIHGAIKYLASQQQPDGSWSPTHKAAITAYVLMAFMAAGDLPNEGENGRTVARGLQYLLDCVRPDGYIAAGTGESNMYGHGIATIALSELYGQTKDANIRPKLEKAIALIVSCQSDLGGWRYTPVKGDADLSVTVLQCVALRAAKNSGLAVPQATLDKAVAYVKSCGDESGGFTYQPHNHQPGFARTAAAIYSLQVCGLYDDKQVQGGSEFLFNMRDKDRAFFTYGNFYAAPAQYMIGGDTWKRWYEGIHKMLMESVKTQPGGISYWDPLDGGQGISPVYATAVYTVVLAMPYHYIPLYQR